MSAEISELPDPSEVALVVRQWTVEEWMRHERQWANLLARSDANPLFLSWEWLTLWWDSFARPRGYVPYILAFYRNNELVGVAPFYRVRTFRRAVPARSVQFIGLSWRDPQPLISEYLDVIAAREEAAAVRAACVQQLLDDDAWTELVVGYTHSAEAWKAGLAGGSNGAQRYVREMDHAISYQADFSAGFAAYLQDLGQSSRRSVWNLRRRLEARGPVRHEIVPAAQIHNAFQDLNRLHQLRWGRPAFSGARVAFHEKLAMRLVSRGELAMSRLWVAGQVISVLYDIRKGASQFNLKMGFDPGFERHASVGLLHFGYALEAAAGSGVRVYDFLAGPGRKTDYKSHLGQARRTLSSIQVLRGPILPRLYRWHDQLQ